MTMIGLKLKQEAKLSQG